ncbi:phage antirepressor protein (pRha domain) [Campylobacter mucosalis]|uniref:Rha family transcriptional regulator n=1 Tax=Campylobacter mucosalis TaxID=202 RepID=UPI00068DA559|nr:Rha family transcriptional regulator [Campylobacter mucosalis]QKF62948.1 phage antirepressor protein (pRha domain) [Campylobacter mucosalis]
MNDLVINHNGTPATTQDKVSVLTDNNEQSVQRLIRTYEVDLKEFGELEFKNIQIKAGLGFTFKKCYYLNEQQATLLLTYMKNTPKVREAKKLLVKAFYDMKQKLHTNQINGYKSQIAKHNNQIELLKAELLMAKKNYPFAELDLSDPKYQPFSAGRPSYKELWGQNISIKAHNNALKVALKMYQDDEDKNKQIVSNLAKIQKELEKSYTAIGAVMAYCYDNDRFFINQKDQ